MSPYKIVASPIGPFIVTEQDEARDMRRRIREGRCACCGYDTEDFIGIGEGIKMCREFCFDPPHHDHSDAETVGEILRIAVMNVTGGDR